MENRTVTRKTFTAILSLYLKTGIQDTNLVSIQTKTRSMQMIVDPVAHNLTVFAKGNLVYGIEFDRDNTTWDGLKTGEYKSKQANLFDELIEIYSTIREEKGIHVISEEGRPQHITLFHKGDN